MMRVLQYYPRGRQGLPVHSLARTSCFVVPVVENPFRQLRRSSVRKRPSLEHLARQLECALVEHGLRQLDREVSARLSSRTCPEVLASRPRYVVCTASRGRRAALVFVQNNVHGCIEALPDAPSAPRSGRL